MQKFPNKLFRKNNQDPFALPGRRSYMLEAMLVDKAAMAGFVQWLQSCSVVGRTSVASVSKGTGRAFTEIFGSVMLRDALRALSTNGAFQQAFRSKK
jgi:hypothetical protein